VTLITSLVTKVTKAGTSTRVSEFSSSSSTGPRARLFVAVELPDTVRAALGRWTLDVGGDLTGVRVLTPDSLHATLCFLGWRPVEELDRIAEACASARDWPRFVVSLERAMWLPERRPRVLVIALSDPELSLAGLRSRLAGSLEQAGVYEPDHRPFLAHVTVGRVGRGQRVAPCPLPAPASLSFPVDSVVLMRSHPQRSGSRYERVTSVGLAVEPSAG
jgi:2'-5' RNA ligase